MSDKQWMMWCLSLKKRCEKLQRENKQLWKWHISGRANIKTDEDGTIWICDGNHDSKEPCKWVKYILAGD